MTSIPSSAPQLVLASTSPYRRELLARLGVPFTVASPHTDETALADETPADTALRLAIAKARSLADTRDHALIIGSDQVASLNGQALGKPGNHDRAVAQLLSMSGQTVTFHTGLCLWDTRSNSHQATVVPYTITLRALSRTQIENYLSREPAYDCAGSAKIEGLGVALVASQSGSDPTALIGLPLITLVSFLMAAGYHVL
jgi:septum formation protein